MSNRAGQRIIKKINQIKQHWIVVLFGILIALLILLDQGASSIRNLSHIHSSINKQEVDKDILRNINIGKDINYAMNILGAYNAKKKNDIFIIYEWQFHDFDISIVSEDETIVEIRIIINVNKSESKFNIYTEDGFIHPCDNLTIPPLGMLKWKDVISCSRRYNISFGGQLSPLYIKAALGDYAIRCEQTSEYLFISHGGINIQDVEDDNFFNHKVDCIIIRSCKKGEFCDDWCHGRTDRERKNSRTFDSFEEAKIFIKKELEQMF